MKRLCLISVWLSLTLGGLAACAQRTVDAISGPLPVVDAGAPGLRDDAGASGLRDDADAPGPRDAAGVEGGPAEVMPAVVGFRSCAEIRAADPRSRDGLYQIDPDGPGGMDPFSVTCDMTTKGGGWTRLAHEDFSAPGDAMGFSRNTVTTCGAFGRILGGYKTFGSETVVAVFDLKGVAHTELRVKFDFVVLDSWDSEFAFADLDAKRFWSVRCQEGAPQTCNQTADQCGWDGMNRNDGKVAVDAVVEHPRPRATLSVGALLDQGTGDESWGIDNLSVFVR